MILSEKYTRSDRVIFCDLLLFRGRVPGERNGGQSRCSDIGPFNSISILLNK
jgi:hypothetical protein